MRIVHLSDIHIWRYPRHLTQLIGKRVLGVIDLARGRSRRFRLDRLDSVVQRVLSLQPDHILITGDITTTALPEEFEAALDGLKLLLANPERVTVVPGNHDRYTRASHRLRKFERYFGPFMPSDTFPWLRELSQQAVILGLDPTRSHISARGLLPAAQMKSASELLETYSQFPGRIIIASHYPVIAPPRFARELAIKRLSNQKQVRDWLATLPPHLYCCGHVHATWAFIPQEIPNHASLNAGAPLYADRKGRRHPGFLEILIDQDKVEVIQHAWFDNSWETHRLLHLDAGSHIVNVAAPSQ